MQAETPTQGFCWRCFATDFTAASTANNTPAPKQKEAEDKHRSRGTWLLDIATWHGAEDHVNHLRRPASWRNVHNESVNVWSMTATMAVAFHGRGRCSLLGQWHMADGGLYFIYSM